MTWSFLAHRQEARNRGERGWRWLEPCGFVGMGARARSELDDQSTTNTER
jgi:hypothetical protein